MTSKKSSTRRRSTLGGDTGCPVSYSTWTRTARPPRRAHGHLVSAAPGPGVTGPGRQGRATPSARGPAHPCPRASRSEGALSACGGRREQRGLRGRLLPVPLDPGEQPALHVPVAQAAQQGGQHRALGDALALHVGPGAPRRAGGAQVHVAATRAQTARTAPAHRPRSRAHATRALSAKEAAAADSLAPDPDDVVVHQAQEDVEEATAGLVQGAALERQAARTGGGHVMGVGASGRVRACGAALVSKFILSSSGLCG